MQQIININITDPASDLPAGDLPQLGTVGNFLVEHPLVFVAIALVLIIGLIATAVYYSQTRVKSLGGGGRH